VKYLYFNFYSLKITNSNDPEDETAIRIGQLYIDICFSIIVIVVIVLFFSLSLSVNYICMCSSVCVRDLFLDRNNVKVKLVYIRANNIKNKSKFDLNEKLERIEILKKEKAHQSNVKQFRIVKYTFQLFFFLRINKTM
jgi:hypothetical protein